MITWKDIQVSEARRQQLMKEAQAHRQLTQLLCDESRLERVQRRLTVALGGWLISLGLRLQSQSADVVETFRLVKAGSTVKLAKKAEQNC